MNNVTDDFLTIALPKGRLEKKIKDYLSKCGCSFSFTGRELITFDNESRLKLLLVKNADLPVYIKHGIAGLGICGEDIITETGYDFYKIFEFPFGRTRMCLAAKKGDKFSRDRQSKIRIATKFPVFAERYFHSLGVPVEIIKLSGSIELAPILGLTHYIVDLVETGNTIRENNLEIIEELAKIKVYLISNPAYYKLNYKKVDDFVRRLKKG